MRFVENDLPLVLNLHRALMTRLPSVIFEFQGVDHRFQLGFIPGEAACTRSTCRTTDSHNEPTTFQMVNT